MSRSPVLSPYTLTDDRVFANKPISIAVEVDKDNIISVSKCIDPQFDLNLLTEALGIAVLVNARYTETTPEQVLKQVNKLLKASVAFDEQVFLS